MRKLTIIIPCLLILLFYQCEKIKTLKNQEKQIIDSVSDGISYYNNKLGIQTASMKTIMLDNSQLKKSILKKDKELEALVSEFTKINSATKYKSITIIDSVKINFKDSIPCIFQRAGKSSSNWYSLKYSLTQKGIELDSISIPTEATIITGSKRKWFLGSEIVTTDIYNTNPYIKISEIKSVEITLSQPWYKKWYVWMAAGIVCGWAGTK